MTLHLLVLVLRTVHEIFRTVQVNNVCEEVPRYKLSILTNISLIEQGSLTTDVLYVLSGRNYDCIPQKRCKLWRSCSTSVHSTIIG